jgi:ketosteroid isomerase-like protein
MSQEDVDAMRAMFDEVAAGDTMAFLRMMDPEVRVLPRPEEPGVREVYAGWEGAMEYVTNWFGQWEEYEAVPARYLDAGEAVLIVFHERGRMARESVQVEQEFSHSFRLEDGLIVEWRMYDTHAQALDALGLSG